MRAATVTDEGDQIDFLLWCKARSVPGGSGAASAASGLAKVALLALEEAGDRPSAAGLVNMEKALAIGEAGEESEQCCNAVVAYNLVWGRDPTSAEEAAWGRQKASLGSREGGKIDLTADEKYGKMQKSSELIGRVTLRRALRAGCSSMFEDWKVDMGELLHAKNLPKAAARLDKVVAFSVKQAHHVWEAQREYLDGYFFKEFLGLGLPAVIAPASALICAGSPLVLAARMKQQSASLQQNFQSSVVGSATASTITLSDLGSSASSLGPSASQVGGDAAMISAAAEQMLAKALGQPLSSLKLPSSPAPAGDGGADAYADRKDTFGRCKFCMRNTCLYISGGKPCREYHQAMNWLGEQRAIRRKASAEEDKEGTDDKK